MARGDFSAERAEWGSLEASANLQARAIVERLRRRGPEEVVKIGGQMSRYIETVERLERLSLTVTGKPYGIALSPRWSARPGPLPEGPDRKA